MNEDTTEKSRANLPSRWNPTDTNSRGTKMVFSCTWYENRKNDKLIFSNTSRVSLVFEGKRTPTITEGRLASRVSTPQRITKVLLLNLDSHLKRTSEEHQKLGTFSWYSPSVDWEDSLQGLQDQRGVVSRYPRGPDGQCHCYDDDRELPNLNQEVDYSLRSQSKLEARCNQDTA